MKTTKIEETSTPKQELSPPVENSEEHRNEEPLIESKENISNLQPKRGKTGPEGAEGFRPLFLLRLEKSLSFTALEDPKCPNDAEKFTEDEENDEDDLCEIDENITYYKKNGVYTLKQQGMNLSKFYKENKEKETEGKSNEITGDEYLEDKQKTFQVNGKNKEIGFESVWQDHENKENNGFYVEPLQIQK